MIAVLADDFSGAAEVAGIAYRYFDKVELVTRFPCGCSADVLVIDTDTRLRPDEETVATLRDVCGEIQAADVRLIFKKVDSVLRGPVRAEIGAALSALGLRRAILAPANPSRDRIIRNGQYFCSGLPLHESDFARDPTHPARTSDVREILGVCPSMLVPDVESSDSWESVIDLLEPDDLPVGAADFFAAWLSRFAGTRQRNPSEGGTDECQGNQIWVCGSLTTWRQREDDFSRHGIPVVTAPQAVFGGGDSYEEWIHAAIAHLETNRDVAVAFGTSRPAGPADTPKLLSAIAETAFRIATSVGVERLFLEGGATARAVVDRFGGTRWAVNREWEPGVVAVESPDSGSGSHCHFVVKPGSYSWPEEAWPGTRFEQWPED